MQTKGDEHREDMNEEKQVVGSPSVFRPESKGFLIMLMGGGGEIQACGHR